MKYPLSSPKTAGVITFNHSISQVSTVIFPILQPLSLFFAVHPNFSLRIHTARMMQVMSVQDLHRLYLFDIFAVHDIF